jgi:hypothetical protein
LDGAKGFYDSCKHSYFNLLNLHFKISNKTPGHDKKCRKYNRRISVGDLNGIGSEIILKTFEDSRMLELCTPVILLMSSSFVKKI